MKTITARALPITAWALISASALFAQSLAGTWQGTLQMVQAPGGQLRTVVKIATTHADNLQATFYSIDQGAQGFPSSSVSVQGTNVRIVIPGVGGIFQGRLSLDGNSMVGTWAQGPEPVLLNLTRTTPQMEWAIPEPPKPPRPMPGDADPSFEVATIKASRPDEQGKGIGVRGRRITTVNTTLSDLITFSYGVHARQIVGAPSWVETEKYDIAAQPEGDGQPNDQQWKQMIQKLLADRFHLLIHREERELSVYAIAVTRGGPKLTRSTGDPNGLPGLGFRGRLGALAARNANMSDLAGLLQGAVVDRPVVDRTGIKGRFDFTLDWSPDEFQFAGVGGYKPPAAPAADALPGLYIAIQLQLGLKLEPTRAVADVLVIDHVEKVSEN
jgi:uncharacterized protein (TIGR03435 family)